ncbi:hypothetical protein [Flavobacterium sp. PL002]|uniref:hypothetical protein n=1 Tax=Flavobacterium sp. PL002 TaxID=1897058 RepID=UPI0017889648|nr:hypothetical protein [Flavobacterium sp. PL002]MBE0393186.1 hypothetical protein [Flavobacterium sp. PL002]
MEGGKIIRIVGETNSIECETWTVYTDKFTSNAGNGSYFTADGVSTFGEPKDAPLFGKYFEKGWWSSDYEGNKKITKAKLGDTVYFQVEMTTKFPETTLPDDKQKMISFKLYEFDGNEYFIGRIMLIPVPGKYPKKNKEIKYITWNDINKNNKLDPEEEYTSKPYTEVLATGNKAVISFQLSEGLAKYFNEFAELKLFMSVTYNYENVDLPISEGTYLDVEPKLPAIKEIYVKLLNYQVSQEVIGKLSEVDGSIQYLKGNDDIMSEKVNMDYFSVRINKLPKFADDNIVVLYKKIRKNFLTLVKGDVTFDSHSEPFHNEVNGRWELNLI